MCIQKFVNALGFEFGGRLYKQIRHQVKLQSSSTQLGLKIYSSNTWFEQKEEEINKITF